MPNRKPDAGELSDLQIESNKAEKIERPEKMRSLVDTQSMRYLEDADYNSYEDLSYSCEQIIIAAPAFENTPCFGKAAEALDLSWQLFGYADNDNNRLLNRDEFAYLLERSNEANREALSWLMDNFDAFTKACFFKDQIGKDDLQAARKVFHGLKVVQENFGFTGAPTNENLSKLNIMSLKKYLESNKKVLSEHESSGLGYLIAYLEKQPEKSRQLKSSDSRPAELSHKASPSDQSASAEKENRNSREQSERRSEPSALHNEQAKHFNELAAAAIESSVLRALQKLNLKSMEDFFPALSRLSNREFGIKGSSSLTRTASLLEKSADLLSGLNSDSEHQFSRDELQIVSKLTPDMESKKRNTWLLEQFDSLNKLFRLPGKLRKRDLLFARDVFEALDLIRQRLDLSEYISAEDLEIQIRSFLINNSDALSQKEKESVERLIEFLESR